jgi:hypothetical protein
VTSLLLAVGLGLTIVGGVPLLLSQILGSIIVTNLPLYEISRHDEPERFHLWRSVMAGVVLVGVVLLVAAWLL